jgi:hypothetical protein
VLWIGIILHFIDDPDQDQTFYIDADPDLDPESAVSFTHVGESDL